MRGLTLAAVLFAWTAAAASPTSQPEQSGPFGLKWGMRPSEVKAALKGRFGTPQISKGGPSTLLTFGAGSFEGISAERVDAEFACDELRKFTVTFGASDARPLYMIWQNVHAKMTAQYGQPTEVEEPPALEEARRERPAAPDRALSEAVAGDLAGHRGRLSAMWQFARGRIVTAVAVVNPTDKEGVQQKQEVVWTFNDAGSETARCLSRHVND